ncbi:ribosomal protein S18-alanine N-acetyltransferase [Marinobacter caseinilyticus]|uniref:ribosomal protein S18-alanine N-acetyltransferase n=1 Tax=Marinobacter caseinilyticus TaxID=2692195 RepID=UPI001F2DAF5E|nr:ribosomal protein S18-alanine N-acetyltransferase [Marinobacter caseinilyticus]
MEIEHLGYSYPWTKAVFIDCFRENYRLWALDHVKTLAGYAVVAYMFDEAHLLNICVAPPHQRSGAGRQLLRHLIAAAAHDAMHQVILEVRESNHRAIALYGDEGFQVIGERPGYYPNVGGRENACVMALSLTS